MGWQSIVFIQLTGRDPRQLSGVMEVFYILVCLMSTWMYITVKSYCTVYLRSVHFIVCTYTTLYVYMFLEQACGPIQSKEYWRHIAGGLEDRIYLLFKREQLQRIVSGQHSVWVRELGHLWASVCHPGQEADTWRWAELEESWVIWGQSPKPCLITVLALDLFSYISQHPFFLWVNLG